MMSKDVADDKTDSPTDTAWMITGRLIAGMILYGGIGWLLSLWLGHQPLFVAGGILFGLAASLYLVLGRLNHETREMKRNIETRTQ